MSTVQTDLLHTPRPLGRAEAMCNLAAEIGEVISRELWISCSEPGRSSIPLNQAGLAAICGRAALRALRVQIGDCNADGSAK
jgi:hypothetical protein